MDSRPRRGGVVLRVDGKLFFVPVPVARSVARIPRVTTVPGAPADLIGVAMHEGAVVPVLTIGPARSEMVLCHCGGETVGLVGGEVVRTGLFDPDPDPACPDGIAFEEQRVGPLDVAAIYARVEAGRGRGRS